MNLTKILETLDRYRPDGADVIALLERDNLIVGYEIPPHRIVRTIPMAELRTARIDLVSHAAREAAKTLTWSMKQ